MPQKEKIELRPYQAQAIEDSLALLDQGKRTLLCQPTGGGKTIMAAVILKYYADRLYYSGFFCHRNELIEQSVNKLVSLGVPRDLIGIIKAGHPEQFDRPIQVGSIQTMNRRKSWMSIPFALAVWDECHITSFSKVWDRFIEANEECDHLGLSATPWRLSKKEGLADKFEEIVVGTTPGELIQAGYLVKPKYFEGISVDLSRLRIKQGEFDQAQLAEEAKDKALLESQIETWESLTFGQGRRTIVFSVNIEHARAICKVMRERGHKAKVVIGSTPLKEREKIYASLAKGRIDALVSVGCLTEGFDRPEVSCALILRPTKSRALHDQMIGRALRLSPWTGKSDALILDMSGNCMTHGLPDRRNGRSYVLRQGQEFKGDALMKACPKCNSLQYAGVRVCPVCGHKFDFSREKFIKRLSACIDPSEQKGFDYFREGLRRAVTCRSFSVDYVYKTNADRLGYEVPEEWAYGAIFGANPTLSGFLYLASYQLDNNIEGLLEREFGNWEYQIHQLKQDKPEVFGEIEYLVERLRADAVAA